MNDVHFNYKKTASHGAYYGREKKMEMKRGVGEAAAAEGKRTGKPRNGCAG